MTDTNSHFERTAKGASHGETTAAHRFELPNDFRELAAMKAAIEEKMIEMQTAGLEALRKKIAEESAALGMSAEEVVIGGAGKRLRARKSKSKREE